MKQEQSRFMRYLRTEEEAHLSPIACHDKEELEMLSDEIIEISEGRIIEK